MKVHISEGLFGPSVHVLEMDAKRFLYLLREVMLAILFFELDAMAIR